MRTTSLSLVFAVCQSNSYVSRVVPVYDVDFYGTHFRLSERHVCVNAEIVRKYQLQNPITQDIAEIASEFLLQPIDGHRVVDIVGPQEISLDEWALIAGRAIGKQIRVVTVPGDKLKAAMSQSGMSPEMAALLVEMEEAYPKIQGQFKVEQKRTGKVTFSQFAREVFAPRYKKAAQSVA